MDTRQFGERTQFLIDRCCERRELEPLRRPLNSRASINGLTDGWNEMRDELKKIRAQYKADLKADLKDDEPDTVIELIHTIQRDVLKL